MFLILLVLANAQADPPPSAVPDIVNAADHWAANLCERTTADPECDNFTKAIEFGSQSVNWVADSDADADDSGGDGGGTLEPIPDSDNAPIGGVIRGGIFGDLGSLRRETGNIHKPGRPVVAPAPSRRTFRRPAANQPTAVPRCAALGRPGIRRIADSVVRSEFASNSIAVGVPISSADRLTFIGEPLGTQNVSYVVRVYLDSFSIHAQNPRCGVVTQVLRAERKPPDASKKGADTMTMTIESRLTRELNAAT